MFFFARGDKGAVILTQTVPGKKRGKLQISHHNATVQHTAAPIRTEITEWSTNLLFLLDFTGFIVQQASSLINVQGTFKSSHPKMIIYSLFTDIFDHSYMLLSASDID